MKLLRLSKALRSLGVAGLLALALAAAPALAFAAGDLSNSSVYSETDASNSTATDPGWPEGMAPSRVNDAARALQGALKRDWDRRGPTVTSAGTDTITLTYSVAPTAYVQGDTYCFIAGGTNTGGVTININAVGAKSIKKGAAGSTALTAGDITAGGIACLQYDGTNMQLVASSKNASAGTVTSVGITQGTGISVSGSPVTTSGSITVGVDSTVRQTGSETIWIPAGAMTGRTTNGCAAGTTESSTNKVMSKTLDCDASTAEHAQAAVTMPKSWNLGTITVQFVWESGSTGNVVWGAQCVSIRDDDAIDTAFGTAQTVTDSVTATTDVMVSAATSAITCGGTPAAGAWTVIQLYRDAANGSDTDTGDARLLGAKVIYTTNAANDN